MVARTTGGFQARTVEDANEAALIADQPGLLEASGHRRDAGAPHAQHDSEKLLGERELGVAHAVLRLQEPAGAALDDGVRVPIDIDAGSEDEELRDGGGRLTGVLRRSWKALESLIRRAGG